MHVCMDMGIWLYHFKYSVQLCGYTVKVLVPKGERESQTANN